MSSGEAKLGVDRVCPVSTEWSKRAWADQAKYREMYARSISDPSGFWAEQAERLDWMKGPHKIGNWSFDGFYWITGRVDDVINVSGHRMGTAEVESALVAHRKVSDAAVVGYPHDIKGQGIYAYLTLMTGVEPSEELRKELVTWVRREIGPIASPDQIQFAPGLPKTRSGKIMRHILRKIAQDEPGSLGDTSTLADPAVVDDLVNNRQNRQNK
jgi:acyl-coenzyme A synthetase/AMP-(fatty) acid ligase